MGSIGSDPFQAARLILILRRAGVTDNSVLTAMEDIPRDHFVGEDVASLAFEDAALPIACGQTNLRPSLVGHMLQFADLGQGIGRVLLVGSGSGYITALLSQLAKEVTAVERHKRLFVAGKNKIAELGVSNVRCLHGDGLLGCPDDAPFDRIILMGLAEAAPVALLSQLAGDGWLIQPILTTDGQQISIYDKSGKQLKSMDVIGFQSLLSGIIGE